MKNEIILKEPQLLTLNEIAELLPKLDLFIQWANDVKEYAKEQALKGKKINGYKLVNGRPTRKWLNENEAIKTLSALGFTGEQILETKLLSPAKIEMLLGKDNFLKELNQLVNSESKTINLVEVSDKREEIIVNKKGE